MPHVDAEEHACAPCRAGAPRPVAAGCVWRALVPLAGVRAGAAARHAAPHRAGHRAADQPGGARRPAHRAPAARRRPRSAARRPRCARRSRRPPRSPPSATERVAGRPRRRRPLRRRGRADGGRRARAVTVTLDDAPRADQRSDLAAGARPDDLVIHQQDVQGVVNALWAGGAEAMTIMGQRVVATTAVRCVGNTLLLHGRVYSPPFVVTAVGDPARLRARARRRPGRADLPAVRRRLRAAATRRRPDARDAAGVRRTARAQPRGGAVVTPRLPGCDHGHRHDAAAATRPRPGDGWRMVARGHRRSRSSRWAW